MSTMAAPVHQMKFKLLAGLHITNDPSGAVDQHTKRPLEKVYRPGDIVPSAYDLTKTFANKFERVHDNTPMNVTVQDQTQPKQRMTMDLNKMSIPDLKKLAAEEEIDIDSLKTKDEIVKVIQAAMG